jgi:arylsulfatase A-like enzyme
MGISRRQFLHGLAAGAGAAALGPQLLWGARQPDAAKPNIIVIFTDDQGWGDLSCFGSKEIDTPRIDQMAKEGTKFTDFYVGAPVCSPSRAALLTGCYPARLGFGQLALYPGIPQGLHPDEVTVADVLKTQGYATTCIGKWHVGGNRLTKKDGDLLVYHPLRRGFDEFYGFNSNGSWARPLVRGYEALEDVDPNKITAQLTKETIRFIKANREKPFFAFVSHWMPHVPLGTAERFRGKSKQGPYGDTVEELDWSTGEILKTLKELDLDRNTLVIFTSDNGPWLSKKDKGGSAGPWRGGKFKHTEGGQRVPCVMRWPGTIPAGRTCSQVASTIDFLPTFAALAGGKAPDDRVLDGHDIRPMITGKEGAASPYDKVGFFYAHNKFKPVRRGKWKYADVWGDDRLHDLTSPQHEKRNLADDHPKLVAELKDLATAKWKDFEKNGRPIGNVKKAKK